MKAAMLRDWHTADHAGRSLHDMHCHQYFAMIRPARLHDTGYSGPIIAGAFARDALDDDAFVARLVPWRRSGAAPHTCRIVARAFAAGSPQIGCSRSPPAVA
ncbi:MAG: hypothetical protein IAG13_13410 [Deltaproteobacteria bacterium]|nr:hypothetical protein [Nannocystaceae bacterium]